jgi:hypothetical protein
MLKSTYNKYRFTITGVFFALLVILLMINSPQTPTRNFNFSEIDYNLINDSVPWPTYKEMLDSMRSRKAWENHKLRSSGNSYVWGALSFSISEIPLYDTCCTYPSNDKNIGYYLQLHNFELKPGAQIIIDSDKFFLEYVAEDDSKAVSGLLLRKEIKNVRYAYGYNENGSLLLPITRSVPVKIIFTSIAIVLGIISIFVFMLMPIRLLYRISNGIIFTRQNINTMNWFGWALVGLTLLPPLLLKVAEWVLGNKIPDEIYFPFWKYILDHKFSLIGGLIVLIFANAFKKGYSLQQDQDLTV